MSGCFHSEQEISAARDALGIDHAGEGCAACRAEEAFAPIHSEWLEPDEPEDGSDGWCSCHDAPVCPDSALDYVEW